MKTIEDRLRIVTRARTMSGQRGGKTLSLPRDEAERWVAVGWADFPDEKRKSELKKDHTEEF